MYVQAAARLPKVKVSKEKMIFTDADIADTRREWGFSLLGTVLDANPTVKGMETFVTRCWVGHVPRVVLLTTGIIKFIFSSEEDLDWVLKSAPWMMDSNKPFMFRRWEDGRWLDMRSFEKVPVWVKLPHIYHWFRSEKMIGMIGCMIGDPI